MRRTDLFPADGSAGGWGLMTERRYLPDASVELTYLDPPFNSNRDYSSR